MEELIKAVVLIAGAVVSSAFFWIGWKLYKSRGLWRNRHNSIYQKEVPVVNLKTKQWAVHRTLNDYFIDEVYS